MDFRRPFPRWPALAAASGLRAFALGAVVAHIADFYTDHDPFGLRADLWLPLLTFLAAPGLFLGPFAAAVARSRARPIGVVAATAVGLLLLIAYSVLKSAPWYQCAGFLACEAGLFLACRNAALGELEGRLPRPAGVTALLTVGGAFAGACLTWGNGLGGIAAPAAAGLAYAAALVLAWFGRPAPAGPEFLRDGVVGPFLNGVRTAVRERYFFRILTTLGIWWFVAAGLVVLGVRLDARAPVFGEGNQGYVGLMITTNLGIGGLIGAAFILLQPHLFRFGWGIPAGSLMVGIAGVWRWAGGPAAGPYVLAGAGLGVSAGPLLAWFVNWAPPADRGPGVALGGVASGLGGMATALLFAAAASDPVRAGELYPVVWGAGGAVAAVVLFVVWFRPFLEGSLEHVLGAAYRVKAVGPGVGRFPGRGPALVIANHAAWFDPMFLAKIVPGPATPMMSSAFYDLPVVSWLMRNVFGTIRVQESTRRREAPELAEAVRALDGGHVVILFPEGWLRRKDEVTMRRFARGVWQILRDRPNTPVHPCWIEGSWGTYVSHKGGPPGKGKKMDFWHRIFVAAGPPLKVPKDVLADHLATRRYLMEKVLEARAILGLPPVTVNLPYTDDQAEEAE